DLYRICHCDRSCRCGCTGILDLVSGTAFAELESLQRLAHGCDPVVLHDRLDPGGRSVPDAINGLYRLATRTCGMDWFARPLAIQSHHGAHGVFRGARMFP